LKAERQRQRSYFSMISHQRFQNDFRHAVRLAPPFRLFTNYLSLFQLPILSYKHAANDPLRQLTPLFAFARRCRYSPILFSFASDISS